MPEIKHIWACTCGAETPCRPEDTRLGAIWQCPRCEQVWGCVSPSRGGKVWVEVTDDDVAFHDLLGKNREPEDEPLFKWDDDLKTYVRAAQ